MSVLLAIDVRPKQVSPLFEEVAGHSIRYTDQIPADEVDVEGLVVAIGTADTFFLVDDIASWAHQRGLSVLPALVDGACGWIGPYSMPGRAPCPHCAHERIVAARGRRAPTAMCSPELAARVSALLAGELITILDKPPTLAHLVARVLLVDADAGGPTWHRVIPLAYCRICGGADKCGVFPDGEDQTNGTDEPLDGWIDPFTGVIPALRCDPVASDGLSSPLVVTAANPHLVSPDGTLRQLPAGWGKGLTSYDAVLSAVGEAIERYSAHLPDPAMVKWCRPGELPGDVLEPSMLGLYGEDQYRQRDFPYVRYDPDACHPWVRGRWLESGLEVWVHGVFAYLSMTIGPENLVAQGTSSGLAASTDLEDAEMRAVLELVERDAMMTTWLTDAPVKRLDLDGALDSEVLAIVLSLAQRASVELFLLPVSAVGFTVMALAVGDGVAWPGAWIGLGCDLIAAAAARQAILELAQSGNFLSKCCRSGSWPIPACPEQVHTMPDHAAYYFPKERAHAFAKFRECGESVSLHDLEPACAERSLASCAKMLAASNVRVALVEVTSPDVRLSPFRVARAISPDLQPLFYGFGLDRILAARIKQRAPSSEARTVHPVW